MATSAIPEPKLFKLVTSSNYTVSVPASGAVSVKALNLGLSTPEGYKPLAIAGIYCSSNDVVFRSFDVTIVGDNSFGVLRNLTSSEKSVTVNVKIAYCKSNLR